MISFSTPKSLALGLMLSASWFWTSCQSTTSKPNSSPEDIIHVSTQQVSSTTYQGSKEYIGIVEAAQEVQLSFSVGGKINDINVHEGQKVNRGQSIATLDGASLRANYEAAHAQAQQARDAYKRIEALYEENSIAEIKFIDIRTQLEKAESMEKIAKKNLAETHLYAPFQGIIGRKQAQLGENIAPHQTVCSLYELQDIVKINFAVSENEIHQIKLGDSVTFTIKAFPDQLMQGKIIEKGIISDPLTHSYEVKVEAKNKNMALLPGMATQVYYRPTSAFGQRIVIPITCVQRGQQDHKYVWVIKNGLAHKQTVTVGKITPNGVEVLSGLTPGEELVLQGYAKLHENAPVKIQK